MQIKKIIAALALVALAVAGLAGCYNPATVMTVGENEISCGQYLYYQYSAVINAMNKAEVDTLAELWAADFDGVSGEEYVKQQTLREILSNEFAKRECERLGVTLSAGEQSTAASYASYYYSDLLRKNGISLDSFAAAYTDIFLRTPLFKAYYGEGGAFEVSESELMEYYREAFVTALYLAMPATKGDGSALDETGTAAIIDAAERIIALCEEGAELKDAAIELYPELQATLGYSESSYLNDNNAQNYISTGALLLSDLDEKMSEALKNAEEGEYILTTTADGRYFIMQRQKSYADDDAKWKAERETALQTMKSEAFNEYLAEQGAKLEYKLDDKAAGYYSPKKVVIG